ncbi:hypothetical protein Scep_003688 [Stephania cephalantha]|uniref:Uncharacterized protein n=1 Tax=Stephania cephalantha TaxID=152367 RepID=A0AAP0KSK8_9MAGN
MDVKGRVTSLLPFGSQRRSCPAWGALQVMHLTLARILQAFELKTHSNVGVDLEECSGILLSMMHPLQVLMAPRLPSNFMIEVTMISLTRFGVMCSSDQTINFISKEMMLKQLIVSNNVLDTNLIGMLKPVMQSEVSLWIKGLHEKWVQNGNSSVSVVLKTQLEELTFNLLTQMVAGKRYYGSNVAKADEKMAGLFCHAVQQFNYHLGNSEMYDALPFMAWQTPWCG